MLVFLQLLASSQSAGIDRIVPKSHPNLCLDLQHGHTHNGNQIYLFSCWEDDRQRFIVGDNMIQLKNDTSKCMDFYGEAPEKKAEDGNILQVWDCHHLAQHHAWKYHWEDSTIRWKAPSGEEKCMDVFEGNMKAGSWVGLWECNGEQHQKWALGNGQGVAFIPYNHGEFVAWLVSTIILSVALLLSLCCNCFQGYRASRKGDEENTSLATNAQTIGSPSPARV